MDDGLNETIDKICDDLANNGWSIQKNFLPEDLIQNLVIEVKNFNENNRFRPAGIGVGTDLKIKPEIRSDKVLWLDKNNLTQFEQKYWDIIDKLRTELNQKLYLSLREFEAHFAVFPKGAFYKKHIDQFEKVKLRMISCILYLNINWSEEFGGALRIYTHKDDEDERFIDVVPEIGTFVCFRSDKIIHEVFPSFKERFSLTGWLKKERLI